MGYTLSKTAPSKGDPTAKNRVWDFFGEPTKTRPGNRRQSQQPRRKNRLAPTKTASGIPYWMSRDPIGEMGGLNLYGFVGNDGVNKWDLLGNLPVGFNDVYNAVSAAIGLAGYRGLDGLPPNPADWGNLFVTSAAGLSAFNLHSICLECKGKCMDPDPVVRARQSDVCDEICKLAAWVARHGSEALENLSGL